MILLSHFTIDNNCYLDMLIPKPPHKENYYYKPTQKLHIFDIASVTYDDASINLMLVEDSVELITLLLRNNLKNALLEMQILPPHIQLGMASLSLSIDTLNDNFDVEYNAFWLWSSISKIQTWLYTKDGKIYLEISSSYPWLFVDPEPSDNFYSFEQYLANYKPIALHEISKETAGQWIKQSEVLLQSMERPLPR
jgi:hypothetical protein